MVDGDRCAGCGACVDACPNDAVLVNGIAVIDPDVCTGCGACIPVCPTEALSLTHPPLAQMVSG
jgi:electron transfer flavoprotein alpha subunit